MPEERWEIALKNLPKHACIAGVDEVGRGPLAGDVVAAAVVLQSGTPVEGLADSKKLSPVRREAIAAALRATGTPLGIGRASPREIDELNILRASLLAMERALAALLRALKAGDDAASRKSLDLVLVDGRHLPRTPAPAYPVIRGDARVAEISAASIVAKVQRDSEMDELHARFPAYGFDRHRGYPTAAHLDALRRHGVLPDHRRSFAPVRRLLEDA